MGLRFRTKGSSFFGDSKSISLFVGNALFSESSESDGSLRSVFAAFVGYLHNILRADMLGVHCKARIDTENAARFSFPSLRHVD